MAGDGECGGGMAEGIGGAGGDPGLRLRIGDRMRPERADRDRQQAVQRGEGEQRPQFADRIISRAMITRMISLVPSRIWWTRRSRNNFSTG